MISCKPLAQQCVEVCTKQGLLVLEYKDGDCRCDKPKTINPKTELLGLSVFPSNQENITVRAGISSGSDKDYFRHGRITLDTGKFYMVIDPDGTASLNGKRLKTNKQIWEGMNRMFNRQMLCKD